MTTNEIVALILVFAALAVVAFAYYVDHKWTKKDKSDASRDKHFNTIIKD